MAVRFSGGGFQSVQSGTKTNPFSSSRGGRSVSGGGGSSRRGGGGSPDPSVSIQGNTVFINGQGFSVPAENQASFIQQQTGGRGGSAQSMINFANAKALQIQQERVAQERAAQAQKQKIIDLKNEIKRMGAQERVQMLRNQLGQNIKVVTTTINKIDKGRLTKATVEQRTNLNTGETSYRALERPTGGGGLRTSGFVQEATQTTKESQQIRSNLASEGLQPLVRDGQVIGFRSPDTGKNYQYSNGGIRAYEMDSGNSGAKIRRSAREFSGSASSIQSIEGKRKRFEQVVDIATKGVISPERASKIGNYLIKKSEKITNYANRVTPDKLGLLKNDQKNIQFLLGAGAEIIKLTGNILQLPALTVAVIKNPIILSALPAGLLEGVKSDMLRIRSIGSSGAVSAGGGTITALTYILPAIRGGKIIANKIKTRNMARLTPNEVNKIKYVLNKRLDTLEKTLRQKGALTKISGEGFSRTRTGSLTDTKYRGVMRLSKRDATVLQSSVVKLKTGVVYNSISEVSMRFGQKLLPYAQRVGKIFAFIKVNGKIVKIPFSKIKYTSKEIVSWLKDSKGRITANIFGEIKYFKNINKFYSYLKTKHGIRVVRGLYKNPKIKNIPKTKGTSYAFQKRVSENIRRGVQVNVYRTTRGTVRKRIFREKAGGKAIEVVKPTRKRRVKTGKKYTLPKEKRTPWSRTFGDQMNSQGIVSKQISKQSVVPQSKFIPQIARKSFNKLIQRSKTAKNIQKTLVRGATLTTLGTAIVARLASGKLAKLSSVSRLNSKQLSKQIAQVRQETRQVARQVTRQQERQMTRQVNRQQTRQAVRQITRQQTRQTRTRGGGFPKIIKPINKIPSPIIGEIEGKFRRITLDRPVQGYYVVMKRKGKLVKLNPRPFTLNDAKDFLAYRIDNGLSRTAFVVPMGKQKRVVGLPKGLQGYFPRVRNKLRPYRIRFGRRRQLINGFIEKRRFFQDTSGEKRELRMNRPRRKISNERRKQLIKQLDMARRIRFGGKNVRRMNFNRQRPTRRTSRRPLSSIQRQILLKRLAMARKIRMRNLRRRR